MDGLSASHRAPSTFIKRRDDPVYIRSGARRAPRSGMYRYQYASDGKHHHELEKRIAFCKRNLIFHTV